MLKVRNADHNDEPFISAVAYSVQHWLPSAIQQQIKELSVAGVKPSQIISTIQQSTDYPILIQDVYNVRKQLKLESLAGKTPIESLIIVLQSGKYVFDYKT